MPLNGKKRAKIKSLSTKSEIRFVYVSAEELKKIAHQAVGGLITSPDVKSASVPNIIGGHEKDSLFVPLGEHSSVITFLSIYTISRFFQTI